MKIDLMKLPEPIRMVLLMAHALDPFVKDESAKGGMTNMSIELTVTLIVISILLIPVGIKQILKINKTDVGIVSGSTTETIVDNIVPIALIVVLLGLLAYFRTGKGR